MALYTTSLRLVQPATGEYSGTWGSEVNAGLTALVDTSVAGTANITMTAANYTLSTANGASDEARAMFLVLGGTPGASFQVIVPAVSKLYFVTNSTGFAQTVKTSGGSGISVPNGARITLRCDGTNVLEALNYFGSLTLGSLTVSTPLPITSGGTGSASTTYCSLTTNVTGTLPVGNGGTSATTFAANNVLLGNGASAFQVVAPGTSGNVLTSNGTTWTSATPAAQVVDYQEFTSSGTWTKPANITMVYVEAIGAGGGGGNNTVTSDSGSSGGGGGGFTATSLLASSLGSTVTVTVGVGGAGGANGTNSGGSAGGNTSFGTHVTAKGGGGGTTGYGVGGFGGGGEVSIMDPGTLAFSTGGYSSGAGGAAYLGGTGSVIPYAAGSCVMGGAGGGAAGTSAGNSAGGVSTMGGNGGAGNNTSNTAAGNGVAPGGGGGGSARNGGGGSGAAGRVRVWAW